MYRFLLLELHLSTSKVSKTLMVHTMSMWIEIDPQIELTPEEDWSEFGYYTFDMCYCLLKYII